MRVSDYSRYCLGLMAAAIVGAFCFSSPAEAQSPCTGAPGERMVGLTPPGVGISQVPLCANDGAGGGAPQMARSYYAAIAWHPDASDIWIDGGYSGPGAAEDVAIAACNRVMGGGCTSTGEWSNSSMAIIRDRFGIFYNAWLGNGNATRQRVLADCSARQLVPCEVVRTVNARQNRRWPGAEARKIYAVGAWVSGKEGYDRKLYIASGRASADVATRDAVAACQAANPGRKCEDVVRSGSGFIQTGTADGNHDFATVETSRDRARRAGEINCRRENGTDCRMQTVYDSRVCGDFVHDFTSTARR